MAADDLVRWPPWILFGRDLDRAVSSWARLRKQMLHRGRASGQSVLLVQAKILVQSQ